MAKASIELTVDDEVLRAVRIEAARKGKCNSEVIEECLRRDLRLDELEQIWARVKHPLSEWESMDLAYEQLHEMRRERHAAGGP